MPEYGELNIYNEYLAAGEYAKAQRGYESFLKQYPASALAEDALFGIGNVYWKTGKYEKAKETFREFLKRYPAGYLKAKAAMGLAATSIRLGDFSSALGTLQGLISYKDIDRAKVEYLIGESYFYSHERFNALLHFMEAWKFSNTLSLRKHVETTIRELILPELSRDELTQVSTIFHAEFPSGDIYIKFAKENMEKGNRSEAKKYAELVIDYFDDPEFLETAQHVLDALERERRTESDRIGLILPLSGDFSFYGEKVLKGAILAMNLFSKDEKGKFTLVVKDSHGIPSTAAGDVDSLVRDHNVVGIAGPLLSSTSQAAGVRAQILGIPLLHLSNRNTVNQIGNYVFSFGATNSAQAKSIARYAIKQLNLTKFAILYPRTPYGEEHMNAFWDEVLNNGGVVTGVEGYEPNKKEFSDEIKKLVGLYYLDTRMDEKEKWLEFLKTVPKNLKKKEWKPSPLIDFDALFIPDTYRNISIILLYLPYYDIYGIQLLGTNGWNNEALMNYAKKEAEGSVFLDAFIINAGGTEVNYFVERYRQEYQEDPDIFSALGYDVIKFLINVIERSGADRERVMKTLLNAQNFTGITGNISILQNGETSRDFYILRVKNGKITIIDNSFR
ncbi:MAG TPA: penicillin-binding protein activator [bacterium]